MTVTNSFIAELVRDANMLDHLDGYQKRRMLERAVTTIRDMRETIGIPPGPGRDRLLEIQTVALSIELGWRSEAWIAVSDTFLHRQNRTLMSARTATGWHCRAETRFHPVFQVHRVLQGSP